MARTNNQEGTMKKEELIDRIFKRVQEDKEVAEEVFNFSDIAYDLIYIKLLKMKKLELYEYLEKIDKVFGVKDVGEKS